MGEDDEADFPRFTCDACGWTGPEIPILLWKEFMDNTDVSMSCLNCGPPC